MAKVLNEEIIAVEKLTTSICKMTIKSEYIAQKAAPGQFVNVKCSEGLNALLRRPISICDIDREQQTLDIVFQIKGIGTEYLSRKQAGDAIDLIAPLGKGFTLSASHGRIAVVGGGIGTFPLLYLLKQMPDTERIAFLGFRSKEQVVLKKEFAKNSTQLQLATDDGSEGHKGLVGELLEQELAKKRFDMLYICGPTPMLKSIAGLAARYGVPCQVSMEQRMGCGIGACLVCACKTRLGDDWEYSHVCKDGPVFWAQDIIFE
jgi:dihydroorotate dehydrogenase electron transfer subunit